MQIRQSFHGSLFDNDEAERGDEDEMGENGKWAKAS